MVKANGALFDSIDGDGHQTPLLDNLAVSSNPWATGPSLTLLVPRFAEVGTYAFNGTTVM